MSELASTLQLKTPWADETKRVYLYHFAQFSSWCEKRGRNALPASTTTLGNYLIEQVATHHPYASVRMRFVAIGQIHEAQGFENPCHSNYISETLYHARLQLPEPDAHPTRDTSSLHKLVDSLDASTEAKVLRDRAILLLDNTLQLEREELVSLAVQELYFRPDGLRINRFGIPLIPRRPSHPFCTAQALEDWVSFAGLSSGPVFRALDRWGNVWPRAVSTKTVTRVVRQDLKEAVRATVHLDSQVLLRALSTLAPSDTVVGARDRALVLLAQAAGLSQIELTRLTLSDLSWSPQGLNLSIDNSDPETVAFRSNNRLCAVRAVETWVQAANIQKGPLFRPIDRWGNINPKQLSTRSASLILRGVCRAAEMNWESFSQAMITH